MNANTERLLPILVYIQANLEQELSLAALAKRANLSPYHFHRLFRAVVGETVKQYVQRLRLEQAAFRLKIQTRSVIDIAFDVGYNSHESFTRAFRRHFGIAPKQYKTENRLRRLPAPMAGTDSALINLQPTTHAISKVRIQALEPLTVAFIRHLGDYRDVDTRVYERLIAWAIAAGLYAGDNLLMGIGHDDPTLTAPDKLRFDACLSVPAPFDPVDDIGCQMLAGGCYATATYVGPYGPDLYQAYAAIFTHIHNHPDYLLVGLPAVEIYRTTHINPEYELNHTEIYLPILKKAPSTHL
jgi:AraC family transcriptional regulator